MVALLYQVQPRDPADVRRRAGGALARRDAGERHPGTTRDASGPDKCLEDRLTAGPTPQSAIHNPQSAIRNILFTVSVHVLGFHAGYRCRHSGVCCTSGWTIPVEAPLHRTLQAAVAWGHLRLDHASARARLVRTRRRAATRRDGSAPAQAGRIVCFLRAAARESLRHSTADGARPAALRVSAFPPRRCPRSARDVHHALACLSDGCADADCGRIRGGGDGRYGLRRARGLGGARRARCPSTAGAARRAVGLGRVGCLGTRSARTVWPPTIPRSARSPAWKQQCAESRSGDRGRSRSSTRWKQRSAITDRSSRRRSSLQTFSRWNGWSGSPGRLTLAGI